eukprot:1273345-Pleurochrysis_carterae.AAC.5
MAAVIACAVLAVGHGGCHRIAQPGDEGAWRSCTWLRVYLLLGGSYSAKLCVDARSWILS